jgi:hypothetical protein
MNITVKATNDTEDTLRLWKLSINSRIQDYTKPSHFEEHKRPGEQADFFVPDMKGSFFLAILISAFPSQGIKPYHGTVTVDGQEYPFKNVDAYHDAVIHVARP